VPVIFDRFKPVILEPDVEVLLAMDKNLLIAFLSSKRISLNPSPPCWSWT